jgi:hypothetical protein
LIIEKITKPAHILDTEVHVARCLGQTEVRQPAPDFYESAVTKNWLGFIYFMPEFTERADKTADAYISVVPQAGIDTSAVEVSQIIGSKAIRVGDALEVPEPPDEHSCLIDFYDHSFCRENIRKGPAYAQREQRRYEGKYDYRTDNYPSSSYEPFNGVLLRR